jgi:subtilisin family serine protease
VARRLSRIGLLLLACLFLPCALARAGGEVERKPYLVLGKTQLLFGPKAYPAFCRQHAAEDRPALREQTIARLKEIAARGRHDLLAALGNPEDVHPLWLVNAVLARLSPEELAKVRADDRVLWAYPAGLVPGPAAGEKVSEVLPRERGRKRFSPKGKQLPWHLKELHVPEVWTELGVAGEGVVVASFDSGIDYLHADMRENVWRNPREKPGNGKDDDHDGYVDDLYGYDFTRNSPEVLDRTRRHHGAVTSSCLVGDGTSGTVTGVAPRARVMALVARGGPWNAVRAFQYALEQGADVVNMSFSIPDLGDERGLWRMMAENASAAGLVLVSGAGNFQKQASVPVQIRIPEGIPCVICVGGLDRERHVPDFVSLGPVEWSKVRFYGDYPMPEGLVKPDVCAFCGPGIDMIDPQSEDGYLGEENSRRGNSLSAPQAAGVVALMLSANPRLEPWEVKEILESTAQDLEAKGKDTRTGAGLIDAFRAVGAAQRR